MAWTWARWNVAKGSSVWENLTFSKIFQLCLFGHSRAVTSYKRRHHGDASSTSLQLEITLPACSAVYRGHRPRWGPKGQKLRPQADNIAKIKQTGSAATCPLVFYISFVKTGSQVILHKSPHQYTPLIHLQCMALNKCVWAILTLSGPAELLVILAELGDELSSH